MNKVENKIIELSISWNEAYYNGKSHKYEDHYDKKIKSSIFDLNDYPEVEKVIILASDIKKIIIPKVNKINIFTIEGNQKLEIINFENINSEIISEIKIVRNNKLIINISQFSKFINLQYLNLNKSNCAGSLFSLINLKNLERLDIGNTNLSPLLLECLPDKTGIDLPSISLNEKLDKSLLINKILIIMRESSNNNSLKIEDFKKKNKLIKNSEEIIELYEDLMIENKIDYLYECVNKLLKWKGAKKFNDNWKRNDDIERILVIIKTLNHPLNEWLMNMREELDKRLKFSFELFYSKSIKENEYNNLVEEIKHINLI